MLVWSGRGWVIAVGAFGLFLATELVSEAIARDASYYQRHGWTKLVPFLIAAALTFVLGRLGFFRDRVGTFVEQKTGEEVELGVRHTLFWIPARFWPYLLVLLGIGFCVFGCGAPDSETRAPDPSLQALERLEQERGEQGGAAKTTTPQRCLERLAQGPCPPVGPARTLPLRLAIDLRYASHWPDWQDRLGRTLGCVNALYTGTGVLFRAVELKPWDPGAQRHDLYALLARLQRELPPDLKSLVVGITLWDERRVYARSGGEIGLSQRGTCVVPSWPQVENDCLILAHELGHLVGAKHVPGSPGQAQQWVMSWAGATFKLPVANPVARVMSTYRFHPRNREAIRAVARARFTPHGLELPPDCQRRIAALDRCWGL